MKADENARPIDIETRRRYEARRARRQIAVRLSDVEIEKLDLARGSESRSAYVLKVVRKALKL